jgi:membrane protein DedA with SNARE-associated domain
MPVVTLLVLAIVSSVACHKLIASFLGASIVAALISAVGFHIVGYLLEGRLDALILVSFGVAFFVALLVALGFGFMMKKAGTRKEARTSSGASS